MKDKTSFIRTINFVHPLAQVLDISSIILAGFIAYITRDFPIVVDPRVYAIAIGFGALYTLVIFRLVGIYPGSNHFNKQTPIRRIFISWSTVIVLLALTAYLSKTGDYFSRIWFVMWAGYGLFFLISIKFIFLRIFHSKRFRKWSQKNIALVGTVKLSDSVARQINKAGLSEINITGHINAESENNTQTLKILGELSNINNIIEQQHLDEIWITLPLSSQETIKEILYILRHSTVNIRMVPDIFELRLLNQSITDIAGIPLINLCESPMSGSNKLLKILEDKILSILFLVLFSPLFVLIPLLIKATSTGPIFYSQKRMGWNGQLFNIIKFRSMPVDAEKDSRPVWSKAGDNRATQLGSFLRKSNLDEIPQFFNVLKGDMSIVGPRPERPEFVQEFKEKIPGYMQKHLVKAGITGWAQVNGWRGDTNLSTRISHDLYYIENWSLMFDIKIITFTAIKTLSAIKN